MQQEFENIEDSWKSLLENNISIKDNEEKYFDKWEGIVVNNEDVDKQGRCQIRIFDFYDDIPKDSLPWALPDIQYIGAQRGSFIIPENGTIVRGYFDQGDVNKPIFESIVFNQDVPSDELVDTSEDYPHKMTLLQTDQGDYITLNRNTGELALIHRTGASIFIKSSGEIEISPGSTDEGDADLVLTVNGNLRAEVSMDCDIKADGNVFIDASQMVEFGKNVSKMLINNLPNCVVTGAPHYIGNTNVKC